MVRVRLVAAKAGTYRFGIGRGGNPAQLTHLGYDPKSNTFPRHLPFTFLSNAEGLTQRPA